MTSNLEKAPSKLRGSVCLGLSTAYDRDEPRIDKSGGKYKAGIIRSASAIAVGEALGHGMWVDHAFLAQVSDSINANRGVKVRYTHPSMSGDGLSTHIGRAFNAKVAGDHVEVDIHFTKSGRKKPEGDLGGDVMSQAEETPEDFGISIVFTGDEEAMDDFIAEHSENGFSSPDPLNVNNYPHARLQECSAADFVGDPAANANGVFYGRGQELPMKLDAMLSYAIGISDEPSTCSAFSNVSPERAKGFVSRFLDSHGLAIVEQNAMAKDKPADKTASDKPAPAEPKSRESIDDPNVTRSPDGLGATKPGDCGNGFAEEKPAPASREQLESMFLRGNDSESRQEFAKEFCKEAMYNGLTIEEARTEFTAALLDRLEKAEQLASAGKPEGEDEPVAGTTAPVELSKKKQSPSEKLAAMRN